MMKSVKAISGSSLIPYKITDGKIFVFLQKRTSDAPNYPRFLGLFGGNLENEETAESTLRREIYEELRYIPQKPTLLGEYHYDRFSPLYAYVEEVGEDFPNEVTICEGDGGIFICLDDLSSYSITPISLMVLKDFHSRQSEFLKDAE